MPAGKVVQVAFNGGEWAPELWYRFDLERAKTAVRFAENMLLSRRGGARRRPGTTFVAETADSAAGVDRAARLVRFRFSDQQSLVMVFEHLRVRFVARGGQVLDGTGKPVEVVTPYVAADLRGLVFHQLGDVVRITSQLYAPAELTRLSNTAWSYAVKTFAPGITAPTGVTLTAGIGAADDTALEWQYVVTAHNANGEESLGSAPYATTVKRDVTKRADKPTLQWSAVTGAVKYSVYVGRNGIHGFIGETKTLVFKDDNVAPAYDRTPPTGANPFVGAGNYPAAGSFFQQRAVFAGTKNQPQKLWFTQLGNIDSFSAASPPAPDDAFERSIGSGEFDGIRYLTEALDGLLVFTESRELLVWSGPDSGLEFGTPNLDPRGSAGTAAVPPVVVGDAVLWVNKSGTYVSELAPVSGGGWDSADRSILAQHLFDNRQVVAMDFAAEPHSNLWAVRNDGVLLAMAYSRQHEVWGWSRQSIDGAVEDVCCVPEPGGAATYLLVRRTIAGATRRYIERIGPERWERVQDAKYVDSCLTYDGTQVGGRLLKLQQNSEEWAVGTVVDALASGNPIFKPSDVGGHITTSIRDGNTFATAVLVIEEFVSGSAVKARATDDVPLPLQNTETATWSIAQKSLRGLGHLEGKTVSVFGDGADQGDYVVTDGTITLGQPCSIVHAGLPSTAQLDTLDLVLLAQAIVMDRHRKVEEVTIALVDSFPPEVRQEGSTHWNALKQPGSPVFGAPPKPTSGIVQVPTQGDWALSCALQIRQTRPLPLELSAMTVRVGVGG